MPPYSRRSHAARRGRSRRKVTWATGSAGPTSVGAGASSTVGLLSDLQTAGSSLLGATVGPIHVRLSCSSTTGDTQPGVTWGILVFDSTLPIPAATDFETRWMINTFTTPAVSTGQTIIDGSSVLYAEILKIKSMRRLEQLHDLLWFTIKNDGSASMSYSLFTKTLVKLP